MTNAYTKVLTHKWRADIDGILIGTNTAKTDNPSLTNRLYYGNHPQRIVIDRSLQLSKDLSIFNADATSIIINALRDDQEENVRYLKVNFDENFWSTLLAKLSDLGIQRLMIEGGAHTLQSLIDTSQWDEVRLLTAPVYLNHGIHAPQFIGALTQRHHLDRDIIEIYHPNW